VIRSRKRSERLRGLCKFCGTSSWNLQTLRRGTCHFSALCLSSDDRDQRNRDVPLLSFILSAEKFAKLKANTSKMNYAYSTEHRFETSSQWLAFLCRSHRTDFNRCLQFLNYLMRYSAHTSVNFTFFVNNS
jgi:hypothetical protein